MFMCLMVIASEAEANNDEPETIYVDSKLMKNLNDWLGNLNSRVRIKFKL